MLETASAMGHSSVVYDSRTYEPRRPTTCHIYVANKMQKNIYDDTKGCINKNHMPPPFRSGIKMLATRCSKFIQIITVDCDKCLVLRTPRSCSRLSGNGSVLQYSHCRLNLHWQGAHVQKLIGQYERKLWINEKNKSDRLKKEKL